METLEQEFERIFRLYYEEIFIRAVSLLGDEDEAHDAAHDAFARLWDKRRNVSVGACRAYLHAAVRNICLDVLRHRQVSDKYREWATRLPSVVDTETDRVEERLELIQKIMKTFAPLTRKIVEACFYHQSTYKEAADELGVSAGTVKNHVRKALTELKSQLRKEERI